MEIIYNLHLLHHLIPFTRATLTKKTTNQWRLHDYFKFQILNEADGP